ncbi:unnamed protein product [Rangifer tarandus platyrhynchus]|uniref:Uncharacterized protein n=1 Tax=Rangifer tarandus platyrhynchus TaxID=3082113 RepID=A0ABN8Y5P0_RANTA|nr:unnamed protein product [Rangifer tarandus platyrhynchus]
MAPGHVRKTQGLTQTRSSSQSICTLLSFSGSLVSRQGVTGPLRSVQSMGRCGRRSRHKAGVWVPEAGRSQGTVPLKRESTDSTPQPSPAILPAPVSAHWGERTRAHATGGVSANAAAGCEQLKKRDCPRGLGLGSPSGVAASNSSRSPCSCSPVCGSSSLSPRKERTRVLKRVARLTELKLETEILDRAGGCLDLTRHTVPRGAAAAHLGTPGDPSPALQEGLGATSPGAWKPESSSHGPVAATTRPKRLHWETTDPGLTPLSESEAALAGTLRRASLRSLERPPAALGQHLRTDSGPEWGVRPPPQGLRGAFAHCTVTSGLHAGCDRLRPEERPLTPRANPQLHLRAPL